METTRQKKISRLLQKEIAEILRIQGQQFAPGKLLTVTLVRISPDLSLAKVYLSIFPSGDTDGTLEVIIQNTGKIRKSLGQLIRNQMRIVPELAFYIDDSLDYIEKIDNLLKPGE
jgi:ribosome-binding factor A